MCQVHTGTCVALLAPEETDYTACHPEKSTKLHPLVVYRTLCKVLTEEKPRTGLNTF